MGFVSNRRWAEPTIFKTGRFSLMQIYLTAGYPKLIAGYPHHVVTMMRAVYDDNGLKAVRVLRPWKRTEVTRYVYDTRRSV